MLVQDFLRLDPCVSRLTVQSAPSVSLSVRPTFISKTAVRIFMIFCMKLQVHKTDEARFLKKIRGSRYWTKRGEKGSFGSFSKMALTILLIFCQKGALMVLDVCVKFGVQQKSGSPDMGPFMTPKRLFRLFLENLSLDFANFLSEWGFYGTRCV